VNWDSSVDIGMVYGLERRGCLAVARDFLYSTASRLAPGHNQIPVRVQRVREAFSPRVKWSGLEADHLPPSNTKIKNGGAILPLHLTLSSCVVLN
jgi:hypothetical protein